MSTRARPHRPAHQWSLLAFGATWCPPWAALTAMFDAMRADGLTVEQVDVDEDPTLAERHRIVVLPTIVVLRDGTERRRVTGAVSETDLRTHLAPR